jgi:hypothetical protein
MGEERDLGESCSTPGSRKEFISSPKRPDGLFYFIGTAVFSGGGGFKAATI